MVITGNGVTETATIVDCCPTCPGNGDLDMSTGLFQEFGITLDAGVFPITWHLQGDDSSSSTSHSSSQESSSSGLLQEILPSVTIAVSVKVTDWKSIASRVLMRLFSYSFPFFSSATSLLRYNQPTPSSPPSPHPHR